MSTVTIAAAAGQGAAAVRDEAYAAALLTLPALWPARAAALMGISRRRGPTSTALRTAEEAWGIVRSGRAAEVPAVRALLRDAVPEVAAAHWAAAAARVDVGSLWLAYRRLGVRVDLLEGNGYPARLAQAASAPYVLFRRGAAADLGGRTVAIVGTRRATPGGRETALQFGAALSSEGVRVVSGLALGIDAAAHEGALRAGAAPPIGVVAGGFDRPYPARHSLLWQRVAGAGALVSEWPLGTASEGWRFPSRNRLIVALADVVVVVESRPTGGSMLTAELAMERGVPVLAVPGSIRCPTSAGTNRLLGEGAGPACSVDDILTALSLEAHTPASTERRPVPTGDSAAVLSALGWDPVSTDALVARTGLAPARLSVLLAHLELDGWVVGGAGRWQRVGAPADDDGG